MVAISCKVFVPFQRSFFFFIICLHEWYITQMVINFPMSHLNSCPIQILATLILTIQKGMCTVAHFVLQDGSFISYGDFKEKYSVNMNFLTFSGLKGAIAEYIKQICVSLHSNLSFDLPNCLNKIMSICKGSKLCFDIYFF